MKLKFKFVFLLFIFICSSFLLFKRFVFANETQIPINETIETNDKIDILLQNNKESIQSETFESNEKIIIDSIRFGDVFLKGNEIEIKTEINGDLFVMSEKLFIEDSAKINGNIFVLASSIKIKGFIKENVYIIGKDFTLENMGQIDGRFYGITQSINLFGKLNSRVYGQSFSAVLDAKFFDNVFFNVDMYSFGENTNFNSNVTIYSKEVVELPKEKIKGEFILQNTSFKIGNFFKNLFSKKFNIVRFIIQFFSMTLFGYLILALWSSKLKQVFKNTKIVSNIVRSFLIGLLSYIIVPVLGLILLFTIIGSDISFVLLLFMMISVIISEILFSIFIGNLLNKLVLSKIKKTDFFKKDNNLIKSMFCGVTLFLVLSFLPYFGFLFKLFGLIFGVGLFWQIIFNTFDKNDKTE